MSDIAFVNVIVIVSLNVYFRLNPCLISAYALIIITALASATGKKDTPGEGGRSPPDSIEQGAKPPVRRKVEKRDARKTFSKELKTCQRCYTRLCKL